jgi:hypothetical protein
MLSFILMVMVRREESLLSRFKIDLGLLCLIGLIMGGLWLNRHPMTFDADDEVMSGELPPSVGGGEVLLVAPAPSGEDAKGFLDLDFGYAWYNALAQEVGPFRLRAPSAISLEELDGVQLIVIPASAARALDLSQIDVIQMFIKRGGSAIVEMPGPQWSGITGIGAALQSGRIGKRITGAAGSALQNDFNAHLLEAPLYTRMLRMDTVDLADLQPVDVLMEIDGVPAHLHRKLGEGHVFLLAFDFGMAVTSLQQGIPGDDFSIPPLSSATEQEANAPLTIPERLVENPKLHQATAPYADLLERHVLYAPLRHQPIARMWLFPETMMGALAMTHEDGGIGDRATFMARYEQERGWPSTYFISPIDDGMSNTALDALRAQGVSLGLTWHRTAEDAIHKPGGLGRFHPYRTRLNLADQRARLEGWAGQRIHAVRAHNQRWDRDYTLTWRKMAAGGAFIDSTYGPGDTNSFGYLFGTGLPFLPIDRNSLPLPIFEIPYVLSDTAGLGPDDRSVLIRLIKESRAGFHQLLTIDIDADAMVRHPRVHTMETWMQAFELAQTERHWITTLPEFMLFYEGRRRAQLRSKFEPSTRTLTVRAELPAIQRYTSPDWLPSPAVSVPLRYEGQTIESATLDRKSLDVSAMARSGDGVLALIPMPPGFHDLSVVYAAPSR